MIATSRRRTALLLATALAVTSAACGGDDEAGAPTTAATTATTTEPRVTEPTDPAATFPRTVEHAMGATEIPAEPERIVTLDMSFVDAALALETPIVGYVLYQDPDGDLPAYFGDALATYAGEATYMGDLLEPNLEQIAAARPDLILTSKVRHEALYEQLAAIAPTVMSESAGAGWKDNIRLTATALGREARADDVIGAFEARAATVGAAINESAGDPTISIARFLGADSFRLYQRASFIGVVLDDAGLARPENQQATDPDQFMVEVSFENLADAGTGDHLLYTIFGNEDPSDEAANAGRAALEANPLWTALPNVADGTAVEMSDETWMSAVGMFGAHAVVDDLAELFGVDPARTEA
jgi:iron complex transport system substrate-binding protein